MTAIWEGSGNVIALDVLRAVHRQPHTVDAFVREVELALGQHPTFDAHVKTMHTLLAEASGDPATASHLARRTVEAMALALQGSLLLREAPSPVAEGFIAARLGDDRSLEYGALPAGLDVAAIAERA